MSVNVEPPAMETRSLLLRRLVVEDAAAMLSLSNEVTTPTSLPSQVDRDHAHDVAIEHRIERVLGRARVERLEAREREEQCLEFL